MKILLKENLKIIFMLLFFFVAYLFFLIFNLPAKLAFGYLSLPKQVTYSEVKGTLWKGKLVEVSAFNLSIDEVNWALNLNKFNPSIDVNFKIDNDLSGEMQVTLQRSPELRNIILKGDVNKLQELMTQFISDNHSLFPKNTKSINNLPKIPFKSEGKFLLNVSSFSAKFAECLSLEGQLKFSDLKLVISGLSLDLGNITTPLSCENNQLILNISQNSEVITSYLNVNLGIKHGDYIIDGFLESNHSTPDWLLLFLNKLPSKENLNSRILKLNGRI